jgi:hypothetical protein
MSANYDYLVPTLVSQMFGSYKNEESRYRWLIPSGFHTLSTGPLVSEMVLQMNIEELKARLGQEEHQADGNRYVVRLWSNILTTITV